MKLKTCVIGKEHNQAMENMRKEKSDLIDFISKQSSRYGDKLVEFMDIYQLYRLEDATIDQLHEYIATHCYNLSLQAQPTTQDRML